VSLFSRKRSETDFAVEVRAEAARSKTVRSSMLHLIAQWRRGVAESYLFSKNGQFVPFRPQVCPHDLRVQFAPSFILR
jgi:hypothetical protein